MVLSDLGFLENTIPEKEADGLGYGLAIYTVHIAGRGWERDPVFL